MLVDGVDVKEIVLHLADDPAERRQAIAEDPVLVHPTELVRHAVMFAEDLQEARAIFGIAAEARVDPVPIAPKGTQRTRRHAFEFRVPLQRQKRIEHGGRPAFEQRFVTEIEELVDGDELVVDRDRFSRHREQFRVQVLQEDHVRLADDFRGPVIALHQLLAGAFRRGVGELELARERVLLVEHEPVLAPARKVVKPNAQGADEPLLP